MIENIILTKDQKAARGTIYGIVTDAVLSRPIPEVDVVLYKEIENIQTKIAETKTIGDGGYVLEDLASGSYNILFSKSGYYSSGAISLCVTGKTKQSVQLEPDLYSASGTISGTVKNSTQLPLAGAFVGLFAAPNGPDETLIATTHANINGKYLFGGVDAGQYIVKSKLSESI